MCIVTAKTCWMVGCNQYAAVMLSLRSSFILHLCLTPIITLNSLISELLSSAWMRFNFWFIYLFESFGRKEIGKRHQQTMCGRDAALGGGLAQRLSSPSVCAKDAPKPPWGHLRRAIETGDFQGQSGSDQWWTRPFTALCWLLVSDSHICAFQTNDISSKSSLNEVGNFFPIRGRSRDHKFCRLFQKGKWCK